MFKKGDITFSTIAAAVLVLIVILVVIFIFTGVMGDSDTSLRVCNGVCVENRTGCGQGTTRYVIGDDYCVAQGKPPKCCMDLTFG